MGLASGSVPPQSQVLSGTLPSNFPSDYRGEALSRGGKEYCQLQEGTMKKIKIFLKLFLPCSSSCSC